MAFQKNGRTPSLLDQVCERLTSRTRARRKTVPRAARTFVFESCEPRNMLAGVSVVDPFSDPNPAMTYFDSNFNTTPFLVVQPSGPASPNILGGYRDIFVETVGGPGMGDATGFVGVNGSLGTFNFATGSGSPGTEVGLQYSGANTDMLIGNTLTNAKALNADLTSGGVNQGLKFDFDFLQIPAAGMSATIDITTSSGDEEFTGTIPANSGPPAAFSYFAPFASFVPTSGVPDLTHVTSVKILFNSAGTPDVDLELNSIEAAPQLTITKVDNAGGSSIVPSIGNVLPGQSLTYTVVVSNLGPTAITGAAITDPFPANFTGDTYTATATGGATGFTASGSGNINDLAVNMPAGSKITYVVTGAVSSAATGTLTNVATVTPPAGSPVQATDIDNLPNLSITKVDNAGGSSIIPSTGNVNPGQSLTYTIVVGNSGPGFVNGAHITDPFPANFTSDTYTATATGGATGFTASGSGNINDLSVNLPSGSTITYVVTGTVNPTATGTLTNTATVTPPVGPPKTATDVDNLSNLSITKVDNAGGSSIVPTTGNVIPGQSLAYTIVVGNSGPGNVTGAAITDPFPANFTSDTYTATATGGANGYTASGAGNINDLSVNLPSGSTITYVVTGTVNPAATGTLTNTATVTPPVGTPKNATDVDNLANLSITKVDNAGGSSIIPTTGNVTPGQTLVYTIVVGNSGPGFVTGAAITDPFPANFTSDTYTASATGGAIGFTASGAGNINDIVNLPSGSTITYVVTGTVNPAATGTLTNTATVAPPVGTPKNATDVDNLANLSITKVDNAGGSSIVPSTGNVIPGQTLVYTIVVGNSGPGNEIGAAITDPFPGNFTSDTYTASATGGATGFTASGSGNINDIVNLPSGSTITYIVTGTVNPAATGMLTNTATITPPVGTPKNATDVDNLANLSITKVDNAGGSSIVPTTGNVIPGQSLTYTIVVGNSGLGFVTGASVTDPFPANFTSDTYTASGTGGASGFTASGAGNINDIVNLPSGSTITYVVTGTVSPAATGTLTNTATVAPPVGTPKNATDVDNLANLAITKVDNAGGSSIIPTTGNVTPGQTLVYTIVVSNSGPGDVTGAAVTDPFPANFTSDTYTASATGGATGFTASGAGNINDIVNLPSGSSITYVVTGTVNPAATGTLTNTATVAPPVGTPKNATDVDNLANLSITKVDNAGGSSIVPSTGNVIPGQTLVYTIVVGNSGPGNEIGAAITDPFPGNFTSDTYTASATGGATGFTASGSGNINDIVNLPSGSTITYVVTGTVNPAATGTLTNTATITPPAGTPKNATDIDNLANLSITKVDNAGGSSIVPTTGNVIPGQSLTYTIVVGNSGPGFVTGAAITDPFPANFTSDTFTATATGGASGFTSSGAGNINDLSVNLPSGSTITYVVTGTVSPAATGTLTNTATVAPPVGTPKNATDVDNLANLSITKVDNAGGSSIVPTTGNVTPGQTLVYTIVVTNSGPGSVTGAAVTDPFPANFTSDTFTASATGGATGFTASGSGNINDIVNLPSGSTITYVVTGTVNPAATGTLTNTATVTPPVGTPKNATDVDNLANLSITKVDDAGGSSIIPTTGTVTPGQTLVYTIVVSNSGPGSVTGAAITDPFPAFFTSDTFTASALGGATGFSASGAGNINDLSVNMPAGSTITYVVTGTVSLAASGTLTNTATVTPPAGTPKNATDIDNIIAPPHLTISKVDNAGGSSIVPSTGNVIPGQTLVYTIVVSNTGLGGATGVNISDPFPANFTNDTYTATATGGATGFTASGSGNINDFSVNMPAGSTITYVVTGTVSSAASGTLSNTASAVITEGTPVTATDSDNIANLSITKVDNAGGSSITPSTGNVIPGQSLTYTIVVGNSGPGFVNGASITDPFPANFTSDTYTASATGGATGFTASGSGNINDLSVNLPAGSTITYVVTGTVSSAATGTLTNTATVAPPVGTPKNATDVDNIANLSITKVDNAGGSSIVPSTGNVIPGQILVYTVVVSNSGPGSVTGASVTDPFPANFTGATYTTILSGGATDSNPTGSGNISDTVSLPSGGSITYVVTGTVSAAATGTLTNTATITPPVGTPKNATDVDDLANLSITKVDNAGGSSITPSTGNVIPGQTLVYTIVVSNTGTGSVTGAHITDPFPANFTSDTFTATATGGATGFTASGSGNINDLSVNLPAGSTITYVVTGTVSSAATGTLTNTATVTPPVGTPKNATDVDNVANLSITKVDNAGGSSIIPSTGNVTPGQTLIYTIVVSNSGPGSVTAASITDPFPANFTSDTYTATATGGATGFTASGSGNISDPSVNLPAGSSITYVVTGVVNPAATGTLTNTATVTPPVGTPKTATDIDNLANLSITKVDNAGGSSIIPSTGNVIPGQSLTYTIVVGNSGPGSETGAHVTDPFPANLTGVTYSASATGGATGFTASGSGNVNDTVNLPSGSTITYVVTGTVSAAATGTLTNTATITPPSGTPKNATDVDNLANLSITKVDNRGGSSIVPTTGTVAPAQSLTYTIVVSNTGTGSVTGAHITDPFPANFINDTFTATATGGATGFTASGTGNINDLAVNLPAGSSITYVVTGTVAIGATGTLSNTATVTPPVGTPKTATDLDNVVPGALSGYVYVDSNNNGIKDPGELPIAGVTVTLTGTTALNTPVNIVTTTDGMGFYNFTNLAAGTYAITETQPVNFIDGKDTLGNQPVVPNGTVSNDMFSNIVIAGGTVGTNNNFGELGLAPPFVSKRDFINPNNPANLAAVQSLSGYVYSETTAGSPVYDPANPPAGETPLAGVTVTLTGPGGTKTTTTTAAGAYSFTNLAPGSYTITETTPSGTTAQTAFVGSQGTGTAGTGTITGIQMTANVSGINNDFPNLVTDDGDDGVVSAVASPSNASSNNGSLNPAAVDLALADLGSSSSGSSSGGSSSNGTNTSLKNALLGRS